jgi:hypothetical protein
MSSDQGCLDERFMSYLVEWNSWVDESMEGKAGAIGSDKEAWTGQPLYPMQADLTRLEGLNFLWKCS